MSDQVTLVRGRHILHFGGEVLINRADSTAWGNINAAKLELHGCLHGGQQRWIARISSGVAVCRLSVGLCQILVGVGFAGIWRPAEESGDIRPGRLQTEPEAHPEPRLALGGQHRMVGNLRQ